MGGGTRPRFPPRPEDVRPLRALVQPRRRAPRLRRGRAARAAVRAHFVGGVPRLPRRLGPRERPLGRRRPPRKSGGRADDGQPAADPRSFRILRPTLLNIVQLLGWTAFELLVMAQATAIVTANFLGPWTAVVFVPAWGAVTMALALGGPLAVVRNWLERFAIWIVYGSTIAVAIALLIHPLDASLRLPTLTGSFGGPGSLLLGLDLVVAMPISWWPLISDYNRFARAPRDAAAGTTLGYIAANTSFYALGAALAFFGITAFGIDPANPYAFLITLSVLGLGALPLIAILVDETDNAFADVYSAAVSVQNLSPRRRQAATIVAASLLGIAAAGYLVVTGQGIGGPYELFLLLIGGLFVPLLGVVIAQTFAVRRRSYARADFFEAAPRWRWPAFASWIPGSALYFAIVLFSLPIGATLPSFALAAGLQVLFAKVDQSLMRPSATTSGGNP